MRTSNFVNHPVVLESGIDNVFPCGLFVDGVPVTKTDSVQVYYMSAPGGQQRWVLATLLKSSLCGLKVGCPCRGHCSVDALEATLCASFKFAARGVWPAARLDGEEFHPIRDRRASAFLLVRLLWLAVRSNGVGIQESVSS